MLLEYHRQLLTAYVDGELSNRQRRHVARLLRRSSEARQLLQQLREDARTLRHLPRPALPADLTVPVLRTIAERRLTPGPRRAATVSAGVSWMGPLAAWSAAAAVLILLGAASYLYFALSLPQPPNAELVQSDANPSVSNAPPVPSPAPSPPNESPRTASRQDKASNTDPSINVKPPTVVQNEEDKLPPPKPDKPLPSDKGETALTDRLDLFQLERVSALLPVVVKVGDLERESSRKDLLAELRKDSDFRVELPCGHGSKAMERVQNAARVVHLGLIIDKPAQERIKQKWRTNYLLYIENVTPEELTRLVRQIGAEDRKSAAGKPSEAQIDRLVLLRMTPQHRKELSTLLGIDPTAPPAAKGPLGTDPHTPLSELTARQLGQALAGQGGTPRPEAGKPTSKAVENFALVMAYHAVRPSTASDEIKRFLDSRKPPRPGTLRIVLVLRG
jgi:hypothetical protein